jgi:hypothetical protein
LTWNQVINKKLKFSGLPIRLTILLAIITAIVGCESTGLTIQYLGKNEIDLVADAHYRETQALLQELTVKLYKRNPFELGKAQNTTIKQRVKQIFDRPGRLNFAELNFSRGTEALTLALDENFQGDRVLAIVVGLVGMYRNSYEYRSESFMFDQLDEQKLYQSARNTEILLWRLRQTQQDNSRPLLLTNSLAGEPANLSFERLFGKLIALQDMMAVIVSQQNDRLIIRATQGVASMVFFPL